MKNFFFSIVIPTYNSEKTVVKCLESCFNQEYKNFEIIIVDDCSQDNTIALINEYVKKINSLIPITIVTLDVNKGASYARNYGIKIAKGDYIALLDSDDMFYPEKLKIVNEVLFLNQGIDLLGHDYSIDDQIISLNLSNKVLKKITCSKLLFKNFAVTPSVVFKKNICLYFNEKMRYTEDHDFFLRVCLSGYNIYYLDLKLVKLGRIILSEGGQSSNNIKMRVGEMKMYLNLYKINKMFLLIIPFLILFSLLKHLIKYIQFVK